MRGATDALPTGPTAAVTDIPLPLTTKPSRLRPYRLESQNSTKNSRLNNNPSGYLRIIRHLPIMSLLRRRRRWIVFTGTVVVSIAGTAESPKSLMSSFLAPSAAYGGQYHIGHEAVSPAPIRAVSPSNSRQIGRRLAVSDGVYFQRNRAAEVPSRPPSEIQVQYQNRESEQKDRQLMLLVGLGLGLAYLVFLAGWFWATRLRLRPSRH